MSVCTLAFLACRRLHMCSGWGISVQFELLGLRTQTCGGHGDLKPQLFPLMEIWKNPPVSTLASQLNVFGYWWYFNGFNVILQFGESPLCSWIFGVFNSVSICQVSSSCPLEWQSYARSRSRSQSEVDAHRRVMPKQAVSLLGMKTYTQHGQVQTFYCNFCVNFCLMHLPFFLRFMLHLASLVKSDMRTICFPTWIITQLQV